MMAIIWSLVLALAYGCAAAPAQGGPKSAPPGQVIYTADGGEIRMEGWVRDHPMPAGQEIFIYDVSRGETCSTHLIQVRRAEALHVHEHHDLVAVLQKGYGTLRIGSRRLHVEPGSVVVIPRGTPHSFVSESPDPAVAFVVFSPPYDGQDTVPIAE